MEAPDLHLDALYVASAPTSCLDFKDRCRSWHSNCELAARQSEAKPAPSPYDIDYSVLLAS